MKLFLRKIHIIRALKIAAVAVIGGFLALLLSLYFLPALVSSSAAQNRIQQSLSSSLKRQVAWSSLVMTRSGGLTLSSLKLGEGPPPLLQTSIDQIVIIPSVGRGADGRFGIDLVVRIQNVRAEFAPGPKKTPPPPPAKDPLTLLAESIQRIQELDFPLPVDLRVMVEAAPLQIMYRAPGKQLRLEDFSFRFAMPSLAAKPVTAELDGRVSVGGREMGSISLNAKVSDLVTKARRIRPSSALFAVDASAPGTNIKLSGGLSQADGFAARCKLDLPLLLATARPFVPPSVPKLEGIVHIQLLAKADADRDIHATLNIDGAGLSASGASLKTKRVGPLDLKLQQQIAADHARQLVDFPGGSLVIPGLINAGWSAKVTSPTLPERTLDAKLGPLRLDLARARHLAAPFLPHDTPVKNLVGEVFLRSLTLHLDGPGNKGDLAVAGFGVKMQQMRLALKGGELAAEDFYLLLEKWECLLAATLPTRVTAELLWSIKRASLSGTQPLIIQGGRGRIGVAVNDLNLKSGSPRKVAASALLTQALDLDHASLGTQLIIKKVHQQLRLQVRASENGEIEANLPELAVTAASLQGTASGERFAPVPLFASVKVAGLRIPSDKRMKPTLQRAVALVSLGDFLQINAEGAFSGSSPLCVVTKGTARFDLQRATPFAAPFVPAGLKGDGVATLLWDLAAPLPEKAFVAEKHPLRMARTGLALFDKFELGLKLDNISATLPSAKGEIRVTGLRSKPDLQIVSTKNGEVVSFKGGVQCSGLSGFPGAAGKLPPQYGSFVFNGGLSGWREFRLREELKVDPLAVSHEAELNVGRIDTLLDEKEPFSTATLIRRLDATLSADVDGKFARGLKPLLPGFDLAGNASGTLRADLSAGRELALQCSLKTKDFGVRLANGTKIEGLRSDIAINRVYALSQSQGDSWMPLSTALVRPPAVVRANPGAAEIAGRIHEDLRGNLRGARSFSIRRVTTKVSGMPLELTALEGDLLFNQQESGLSFFQADLLGGTLLARGVLDLRPDVPVIAAAGSFSNLDVTRLLPKETRSLEAGEDAEITGEVSLSAPLTDEQRELFEQLRLVLNLRKIGANTLERALFSLDPYERNEQLVAQRKMLRYGRLKGLRATAVDGAFSMEGEVLIKGIAVNLPKVERVRISELPLRQELVKNRSGIMALRGFLDLLRADMLVVGPKGELSLKRRNYEK
jgi:translocation and assembly module TamB